MALAVAASVPSVHGFNLGLPNKTDSLKFAVIGDFGTGNGGRLAADYSATAEKITQTTASLKPHR